MRKKKTFLNTAVSFASQLIIILLGFISRRVLIYNVGVEYLGINGLMANLLTVFSIAESGIGVAIGYALYKPLAENDKEKIKSLMHFFKTTYHILAGMTAVIGIVFYPFLPFFLKGSTAPNTSIIYFMFLFSSVVSYLWVYKTTLNGADQNKYLYTIANTITQIVVLILKILVLYYTRNYIVYLTIDIGTTIIKNVIFSRIVDKRYPFLKEKNIEKLDDATKSELKRNVKALFINKVGYILSTSSDNLVISSMIGVSAVGLYSNYTTLVSSISGFTNTFSSGVVASMGNLIASDSKSKVYEIFKTIDFINYCLYTVTSICLFCLIELFVGDIWLRKEFVLGKGVLIVCVLTYFFKGINSSVQIVKDAAGLFVPDRYVSFLEAIVNIIMSIALARRFGLFGVLFATLVSFVGMSFWIKPYFIYRDVFDRPFSDYVALEGRRILSAGLICWITYCAQSLIIFNNPFLTFLVKALVCVIVSSVLLILINFKTDEYQFLKGAVKQFLK